MKDEQGVGRAKEYSGVKFVDGYDGEAYGFLKCPGSDFATVDGAVSFAKKDLGLPSELELTVEGTSTGLRGSNIPAELREFGKKATAAGMDYMIKGRLPGYPNKFTAGMVNEIMYLVDQDPELYGPNAAPRQHEVVFEKDDSVLQRGKYDYVD